MKVIMMTPGFTCYNNSVILADKVITNVNFNTANKLAVEVKYIVIEDDGYVHKETGIATVLSKEVLETLTEKQRNCGEWYWTSTAYDSDYLWVVYFDGSFGNSYDGYSTDNGGVRLGLTINSEKHKSFDDLVNFVKNQQKAFREQLNKTLLKAASNEIAYRNKIDEVLDIFDFEKVHKVMTFLNWKWAISDNGVPEIYELRAEARRLLLEAFKLMEEENKESYIIATGGFKAEVWKDDEYGCSLEFVLEEV